MMRWVLIAAIVFIVWRLLTGRPVLPGNPPPADPDDHAEAMVRCKLCGTHVPAQRALLEEHRDEACR